MGKITRHEVKGDKITFFHNAPRYVKDADGFYKFNGQKEVAWFDWTKSDDARMALTSNGAVFNGSNVGGTCFDRDMMEYLRRVKGAKLISSEELPWYDETPYGKSVIKGTYNYEVWDLSKLF